MISYLRGSVSAIAADSLVVQVGGVGFRVFVPRSLLADLPGPGREIDLHTHLHVREGELTLYGCATEEELALFYMLLGVSGVGPKVALSILSTLPPQRLREAIGSEDTAALARVPGIGPKTARKIVFDLRDRVLAELPPGVPPPAFVETDVDLVAALTGLGYSLVEAQEAIRSLPHEELPLEERVRLALAFFVS